MSAEEQLAQDQIRRAHLALQALAARDGGGRLASQLAGLVAVLAETASAGGGFNSALISALGAAPDTPSGPSAGLLIELGIADAAQLPARLKKLTVPELRQRHKELDIPDCEGVVRSKARKSQLIDAIVKAVNAARAGQPETGPHVDVAPNPPDSIPTENEVAAAPVAVAPPKRKRQPALVDPYAVFRAEGEAALRSQLAELDLEQLKDVLFDNGIGSPRGQKVEQLVDHIVERVNFGVNQGSAFRNLS